MRYIRVIKITFYILLMGLIGYILIRIFGYIGLIGEVLLIIFMIIPSKIRTLILGEKESQIQKENLEPIKIENTDLDLKFLHVYAIFFYSRLIYWEKGERTPLKKNPRYKYIINTKTYKAYYMTEYAMSFFIPKYKIQWLSEDFTNENNCKKLLKSKKIRLIERPANQSDLLEEENFFQKILRKIMIFIGVW
ncbi:MAG: hypothetical protein MUO82_04200 [Candidatus Thermoplasmatota archaeon]|nr:hypothetical protein [Candidatus Thermoplasmatota archaeon]